MKRRKLYVSSPVNLSVITICETSSGKVICTMPRDEQRLARFIVRCVNLFGFGLRPYDRQDWLHERNVQPPMPPAGYEKNWRLPKYAEPN